MIYVLSVIIAMLSVALTLVSAFVYIIAKTDQDTIRWLQSRLTEDNKRFDRLIEDQSAPDWLFSDRFRNFK